MLRALLLVMLCLGLAGCATDGTSLPSFGCNAFKPIHGSKKDTTETRRQVAGHNAVGVKLCGWVP